MNGGQLDPHAVTHQPDHKKSPVDNRRWYVAAAAIMTVALAGFYVALGSFPDEVGDYLLPGVVVVVLLLALCGYRPRGADSAMLREERTAFVESVILGLMTILLFRFIVPAGVSVWTIGIGILPALPFLWLVLRAREQ